MSHRSRSLGKLPQPAQEKLTIMDRPASALKQLSKPNTTHQEVFKTLDFTKVGNVEDFIQQFHKVAAANDWQPYYTSGRI